VWAAYRHRRRVGNDYYDRLSERRYAAVLSDVLDDAGYRDQALVARITHSRGAPNYSSGGASLARARHGVL
jgi:hypothetical protein